ncbi:MAG: hypothetical protein C0424_06465 [Sphingobacteriaceae bacterium]|nr:hypothetical protein [Sphingobacteriaceae bacterium]
MNRLIIIGNGFDLAHGLRTSYSDFTLSVVRNALEQFDTYGTHNSDSITIQYHKGYHDGFNKIPIPIDLEEPSQTLSMLKNDKRLYVQVGKLLNSGISNLNNLGWVDFERNYYHQLLGFKVKGKESYDLTKIEALNAEFGDLKNKLAQYLLDIQRFRSTKTIDGLGDLFTEPINIKGYHGKPDSIVFMNFNYTNTVEDYVQKCAETCPTQVTHMHGKLDSLDNPIVFGYGDNFHAEFLNLIESDEDCLLENLKPTKYPFSDSYQNILDYLELPFEVYVFGHSLGMSDRALLRVIFEHQRCKKIKIFYHQRPDGTNDYGQKVFNLTRIFTDLTRMNKINTIFKKCSPMPVLQ